MQLLKDKDKGVKGSGRGRMDAWMDGWMREGLCADVQFVLALVWAAQAVLAVRPLVAFFTLTAVALAGSSPEAHGVVDGATAVL